LERNEIRIGAACSLQELIDHKELNYYYPIIGKALSLIGALQHRNMGSIGGNLCLDTRCFYYNQSEFWRDSLGFCMKHKGDKCHVVPTSHRCFAVMASDGVAVFSAINARMRLVSAHGERMINIQDFYAFDGMKHLALQKNEILAEIILSYPKEKFKAVYLKNRTRDSFDFPQMGMAVSVNFYENRIQQLKVVMVAVESAPIEIVKDDLMWDTQTLKYYDYIDLQTKCVGFAAPMKNTFASPSYRKKMVQTYLDKALKELELINDNSKNGA
jgi:4-hydroxybenzoyl-CoA reductase subunit beta